MLQLRMCVRRKHRLHLSLSNSLLESLPPLMLSVKTLHSIFFFRLCVCVCGCVWSTHVSWLLFNLLKTHSNCLATRLDSCSSAQRVSISKLRIPRQLQPKLPLTHTHTHIYYINTWRKHFTLAKGCKLRGAHSTRALNLPFCTRLNCWRPFGLRPRRRQIHCRFACTQPKVLCVCVCAVSLVLVSVYFFFFFIICEWFLLLLPLLLLTGFIFLRHWFYYFAYVLCCILLRICKSRSCRRPLPEARRPQLCRKCLPQHFAVCVCAPESCPADCLTIKVNTRATPRRPLPAGRAGRAVWIVRCSASGTGRAKPVPTFLCAIFS